MRQGRYKRSVCIVRFFLNHSRQGVCRGILEQRRYDVAGRSGHGMEDRGGYQQTIGRIGRGDSAEPEWFQRLERIAVVAPPMDLMRCSENMQRWRLRPYNYFFIRALIENVPPGVKDRADYQASIAGGRPRTLWELDNRITAPLSGFADAADYDRRSSANKFARFNPVPTLVLAAADDPIVPVGCFVDDPDLWPVSTQLVITPTGGHMGFVDRCRRCWIDAAILSWFEVH